MLHRLQAHRRTKTWPYSCLFFLKGRWLVMSYSRLELLNTDLKEFGLEISAIRLRCTVKKVSHTACCVGSNQPVTQKGNRHRKKCFVQMFLWYSCSYDQLFIWKRVTNENRRGWETDRHPDRLCHLASLLFYPSTNRVRMSRHIPLLGISVHYHSLLQPVPFLSLRKDIMKLK